MSTIVWVGDPANPTASAQLLSAEDELIWLYPPESQHGLTSTVVPHLLLAMPADSATLLGRGVIMDLLRQREPEQLIIYLRHGSNQGNESDVEHRCRRLEEWIIGFIDVAEAALRLMHKRGSGGITLVLPYSTLGDDATPVMNACDAFVRAWVGSVAARNAINNDVRVDLIGPSEDAA